MFGKRTNYKRIRKMSVSEMAEFLTGFTYEFKACSFCKLWHAYSNEIPPCFTTQFFYCSDSENAARCKESGHVARMLEVWLRCGCEFVDIAPSSSGSGDIVSGSIGPHG